jgi:hypothetical protein
MENPVFPGSLGEVVIVASWGLQIPRKNPFDLICVEEDLL